MDDPKLHAGLEGPAVWSEWMRAVAAVVLLAAIAAMLWRHIQ